MLNGLLTYLPGAVRAGVLATGAVLLVVRLVGKRQQVVAARGPVAAGQAHGPGDGVERHVGGGQEGGAAGGAAGQAALAARTHRVTVEALPDGRQHGLVAHRALEATRQHLVQFGSSCVPSSCRCICSYRVNAHALRVLGVAT